MNPLPPLDGSLPFRSELVEILQRATAKERDARYPSAEAFADDLRKLRSAFEQLEGSKEAAQCYLEANRDSLEFKEATTPVAYATVPHNPPDLGLNKPQAAGKVRCRMAKVNESGLRERAKQLFTRVNINEVLVLAVSYAFSVAMVSWIAYKSRHLSQHGFRVTLFTIVSTLVGIVLALFLSGAHYPKAVVRCKCRSCPFRRMVRVSKWTRYVTSGKEIRAALNDCVTAMESGYFEDAAKLLCVHGAEDAKIYAVTRYNLEFWECRRCHDQSALLIIEEKIELRWRRRNEYQESYKYGFHPV